MHYLTPAWMEAARQALSRSESLRDLTAGLTLTIEQVAIDVTGHQGGTVRWQLRVDDGRVELHEGPAPRGDLRFTTDRATAAAIASGELGAQQAFIEGRLRVSGDLSLLVRHQRTLAAVDDVLATVRAETANA